MALEAKPSSKKVLPKKNNSKKVKIGLLVWLWAWAWAWAWFL